MAAAPKPIPAKAATPTSAVGISPRVFSGPFASYSSRPSAIVTSIWSTKTRRVEHSTAPRYVAVGNGVARIRFRRPLSRRMTSMIASPAKAVFAHP